MGFCSTCGAYMAEGEYGKCASCAASSQMHTTDDVPCQRCGMYLPRHELQMWNSRLYCNYCIMDLRDEERRLERSAVREERVPPQPAPPREREPLSPYGYGGQCDRCGRQTDTLYEYGGRRLCSTCLAEEGGKPPSSGSQTLGMMVSALREFGEKSSRAVEKARAIGEKMHSRREREIGIPEPPSPKGKTFDIRTRKFVPARDAATQKETPNEKKPESEPEKHFAPKKLPHDETGIVGAISRWRIRKRGKEKK